MLFTVAFFCLFPLRTKAKLFEGYILLYCRQMKVMCSKAFGSVSLDQPMKEVGEKSKDKRATQSKDKFFLVSLGRTQCMKKVKEKGLGVGFGIGNWNAWQCGLAF